MRLISDEDVKALINGLDSLPWEEEVDDLVDSIPTAYDVEKVVERLEALKNNVPNVDFINGVVASLIEVTREKDI